MIMLSLYFDYYSDYNIRMLMKENKLASHQTDFNLGHFSYEDAKQSLVPSPVM